MSVDWEKVLSCLKIEMNRDRGMKEESSDFGRYTVTEATSSSCFVGKGKKRSRMDIEDEQDVDADAGWKGKKRPSSSPCSSSEPRPCTECGKKFWSWKALFGHMRCHPERQWRGINPPPSLIRQQQQHQHKMKTMTMMTTMMTQEDHEVAACLLLLANKEEKGKEEEEHFECSSCNKVFGSHQALGGHRASHKNVKGCFAGANMNIGTNSDDNNNNMSSSDGGHKCSICLRVFSTGQALGGHKRCHWDKGDNNYNNIIQLHSSQSNSLDLNFPPPPQSHDDHHSSDPPLTLDLKLRL